MQKVYMEGRGTTEQLHLPIMTTLKAKTVHQPVLDRGLKWKKHEVGWQGFRQELERQMSNMKEDLDVERRLERFATLV